MKVAVVIALLIVTANAKGSPQDSTVQLAAGVKQIKAEDLKARIDSKAQTAIIDVRDADEFQYETIPGAINIPLETLDRKLRAMPKNTFLVFVCTYGNLSSRAAKLAGDFGFESSTFCPLRDWKSKGYKTVHGGGGK